VPDHSVAAVVLMVVKRSVNEPCAALTPWIAPDRLPERARKTTTDVADRRGGKRDLFLRDELFRVRFDAGGQRSALGGAHLRRKDRNLAGAAEGRLDHEIGQVIEHEAAFPILPAPPGGHRRHPQFFAEQVARHAGQERHRG